MSRQDSKAPPSTVGTASLLRAPDPAPVGTVRLDGGSDLVLACDHAGNAVPEALNGLGLEAAELERHIALDVGALGVAERLSELADAPLIYQRYSRLVIDCNRTPAVASSRPTVADGTEVPGNAALDAEAVERRRAEIFTPYHDALVHHLDDRARAGRPAVLVAVHSFTPRLRTGGGDRPWHVGILFNRDERVGRALITELAGEADLVVGENAPYGVDDESDYTIPVHGERRGIPHVEIEIRQDLLADAAGRNAWGERLARALPRAVAAAGVL